MDVSLVNAPEHLGRDVLKSFFFHRKLHWNLGYTLNYMVSDLYLLCAVCTNQCLGIFQWLADFYTIKTLGVLLG